MLISFVIRDEKSREKKKKLFYSSGERKGWEHKRMRTLDWDDERVSEGFFFIKFMDFFFFSSG
jgi:hypothetical protein